MSGPEILPSSSDGIEESGQETYPIGGGKTVKITYSGTKAAMETKRTALMAGTAALTGLASTVLSYNKGRATLEANYEITPYAGPVPTYAESIQELRPFEMVRDIYTADYFSALTNEEIIEVRKAYEADMATDSFDYAVVTGKFNALQLCLFKHLSQGQGSYLYTAYELSFTWRTTSDKRIAKSCSLSNRVDPDALKNLNSTIKKMVTNIKFPNGTTLATGEWLKKPTEVSYLGKGFWQVVERWIGLPQWSVIYGGTFAADVT